MKEADLIRGAQADPGVTLELGPLNLNLAPAPPVVEEPQVEGFRVSDSCLFRGIGWATPDYPAARPEEPPIRTFSARSAITVKDAVLHRGATVPRGSRLVPCAGMPNTVEASDEEITALIKSGHAARPRLAVIRLLRLGGLRLDGVSIEQPYGRIAITDYDLAVKMCRRASANPQTPYTTLKIATGEWIANGERFDPATLGKCPPAFERIKPGANSPEPDWRELERTADNFRRDHFLASGIRRES
jgi:hypothetical protein